MDIPVRRHENNAYEAARQAESFAFELENKNLFKAIEYIRRCQRNMQDNVVLASISLVHAIEHLQAELKSRGQKLPIDGE